jgi:predicted nucleic acid-binding protein
MNVYVDSSVLLRVVLGQPNRISQWKSISTSVASALVEVECLRTLDRFRLAEGLSDVDVSSRREAVYRLLESCEVVEVSQSVLKRASQPLPTSLGSLDAIHLATATLWREESRLELVMATHDDALAVAARALGFSVIGSHLS